MSQAVSNSITNILRTRFGKLTETAKDAVGDLVINEIIPYEKSAEVGDSYTEAVTLGSETAISIIGNTTEVANISPANASAIKQVNISPSVTVLRSVIPWSMASRSEKSEGSFVSSLKHIVKSHVLSHKRFQEILKIYGRESTKLLGRVSYATATYRSVAFTNGGGALVSSVFGTTITFTAGVDTTNKYILLQPGDNASGIWVGMQGLKVKIVNSSLAVVAEGRLLAYDSALGILKVDFTPVAATSVGSHMICLEGMESSLEMYGIRKFLTNTSSFLGINPAQYPLWKASQVDLASTKLTFAKLGNFAADIFNAAGAFGEFQVLVNPRSFMDLMQTLDDLRRFPDHQDAKVVGTKTIEYVCGDAVLKIRPHRYIMEGEAFFLQPDSWICSGSSDVSMSIKGLPSEQLVVSLQDQTGVAFHTFADVFLLCREPSKQGIITGINDESAT